MEDEYCNDSDLDRIIDSAEEVFEILGAGQTESTYESALEIELMLRGFNYIHRQYLCPLYYKGYPVGTGFIDLMVNEIYVLELKSVAKLNEKDKAQLRKYLHPQQIGLLINFNCTTGVLEAIRVDAKTTRSED